MYHPVRLILFSIFVPLNLVVSKQLLAAQVAETKTAYKLSGVDTRLRLVYVYRESRYTE